MSKSSFGFLASRIEMEATGKPELGRADLARQAQCRSHHEQGSTIKRGALTKTNEKNPYLSGFVGPMIE